MPAFAGVFSRSDSIQQPDTISRMVRPLLHTPAALSGSANLPEFRASVGWTFRDCPAEGGAFFWNEDRTIGALLIGELAGARALGEAGARAGAASVVELYEKLGSAALPELNGIFSGLLVDRRTGRSLLFTDRYGLSRVYWHDEPDGFFFASEAKALLAVLPALREIDQRGLAESYLVGCVLQNRTLFRDLAILPPASLWTFHQDGRTERATYFDPATWEQQETLDAPTYQDRLNELFARVAPRYLGEPGQAAMSLTGGLDSRMLLAWAGAPPGRLPCYTFGGPYRDCADLRLARRIAVIAGQPHTTIPVDDAFFPEFPALAESAVSLSDGTMDVSGAVELYANRRAAQIAPVRLTGNYGSEILRSNVAFRPGRLDRSLFTPEFGQLLDLAADTYRSEAAGHRLSFIAFKQVPWHHYSRLSLETSQLTVRSPFLDKDLVALAYQAPPELATSPVPALAATAAGCPALRHVPTDRALTLGRPTFARRLAHAWQEFTARAEYAYDYGMPQRLVPVDHLLAPLHPERLFLGRHKFYHFRIWYKTRLRSYLESIAADSASEPGCYRPGAGRRLIAEHLAGRRNHTSAISKFLSVALLDRLFVRRASCTN